MTETGANTPVSVKIKRIENKSKGSEVEEEKQPSEREEKEMAEELFKVVNTGYAVSPSGETRMLRRRIIRSSKL